MSEETGLGNITAVAVFNKSYFLKGIMRAAASTALGYFV
jgi:hypothetical protein